MKIAIIADVHGNIFGVKTVIRHLKDVGMILCAGDISGYYPFVDEVIETLKKHKVISVLGNHDAYFLGKKIPSDKKKSVIDSVNFMQSCVSKKSIEYLNLLPKRIEMKIDGKKVLMIHGSPWDELEGRIYPDFGEFNKFEDIDSDVIVMGQTHYPLIKLLGKKIIINPGSCGQPRDYNELSYAIWDTKKNTFNIKRLKWDINGFIAACRERGTPEEFFKVFSRASI